MSETVQSIRFGSWILLLGCWLLLSLTSCAAAPVVEQRGGGVAVWDLDDLSPGDAGPNLGELLSARVTEVAMSKGRYTVVERTRLLSALEELKLGSSGLTDESTRLKLGNLVGARLMVFGCYQAVGDRMRIDLRLVEVETGKILKAVQKTTVSRALPECLEAAGNAAVELLS
jgi:TolB-like protein